MRRPGALVASAVAVVALLLVTGPAAARATGATAAPPRAATDTPADTGADGVDGRFPADVLLLATEGGEGEAPGPEPSGPNATGNPSAPENYEPNFLWGAALGLLGLAVLGILGLGGLYLLLVVAPRRWQQAREE